MYREIWRSGIQGVSISWPWRSRKGAGVAGVWLGIQFWLQFSSLEVRHRTEHSTKSEFHWAGLSPREQTGTQVCVLEHTDQMGGSVLPEHWFHHLCRAGWFFFFIFNFCSSETFCGKATDTWRSWQNILCSAWMTKLSCASLASAQY